MVAAVQNPYDTQPPKATNTGIVSGAMSPAQIQQYNPTAAMKVASFTPVMSAVNKETDTVGGQVNSILATDSPLMQRARALAQQQMAKRGLVNSSMAQGAGVAAMTDKATEIGAADANIYSQRALANQQAANEGGMFATAQNNDLFKFGQSTANQWGMQKDDQTFRTGERVGSQKFATDERLGSEKFSTGERLGSQEFATGERIGGQTFTAGESKLGRDATAKNMRDDRAFTSIENAMARDNANLNAKLDRTLTTTENDKSRTATSANAQLDREQQVIMAQAEQGFRATQAQLDRDGQVALIGLQDKLNTTNVSKTFAANTATATLNAIQAIQADPNITPEDKKGAIQNAIAVANANLQWGSTFYSTPLPSLAAPGGTATTLTPAVA